MFNVISALDIKPNTFWLTVVKDNLIMKRLPDRKQYILDAVYKPSITIKPICHATRFTEVYGNHIWTSRKEMIIYYTVIFVIK